MYLVDLFPRVLHVSNLFTYHRHYAISIRNHLFCFIPALFQLNLILGLRRNRVSTSLFFCTKYQDLISMDSIIWEIQNVVTYQVISGTHHTLTFFSRSGPIFLHIHSFVVEIQNAFLSPQLFISPHAFNSPRAIALSLIIYLHIWSFLHV